VRTAAETLLDGPRGRRLCLEYATAVDQELHTAAFRVAFAEPREGTSVAYLHADGTTGDEQPDERTEVAAEDVAAMIEALAASPEVASAPVPSDAAVRDALRRSVDAARYWQEPDEEDVLAGHPAIRSALTGVAELLLRSPLIADRSAPPAATQWAVDWRPDTARALPTDAAALLEEWSTARREEEERAVRERPLDPTANWSGTWWSLPLRLLQTRSRIDDLLELDEDSLGPEAATVIPVSGAGRTLEIGSAEDWAELCRACPAEVTASRRHDWYRVTGWEGRWLVPDWQRVAADWDAAHLTTLGYLSGATRLIPIDEDHASVIGGWAPDSTLWLTDAAREADAPRQQWRRAQGEDAWRRTV